MSNDKMKKIAFWIQVEGAAFHPGEGICRVLGFLVQEMATSGMEITFLCSRNTVSHIESTFRACGLADFSRIRFLTERPGLRLHAPFWARLSRAEMALRWAADHSLRLYRHHLKRDLLRNRLMETLERRPMSMAKLIVKVVYLGMFSLLTRFCSKSLQLLLRRQSGWSSQVIRAANRRSFDVVLVPNQGWSESVNLKHKRVLFLWDLVCMEYPYGFDVNAALAKIEKTTQGVHHFVTMTEYVRREHGIGILRIPPASITALKPPSCSALASTKDWGERETRRKASKAVVGMALREHYSSPGNYNGYLCDFPLEQTSFIFVSSQLRPYKNFQTLLRAYAQLLRKHRRSVKLVTTGHIPLGGEIHRTMISMGLTFDVISMPRVSEEVLRHLYLGADLVAVPSLFEGGLPLMFEEAVRLGTPVAMGKIPTVLEFVSKTDEIYPYLFENSDPSDIARVLDICLSSPQAVWEQQARFCSRFEADTWAHYCQNLLRAADV